MPLPEGLRQVLGGEAELRQGEEEVEEEVRRCLREGAAGGGYMISSSNAFHSGTLPQNLGRMVEAARSLGRY